MFNLLGGNGEGSSGLPFPAPVGSVGHVEVPSPLSFLSGSFCLTLNSMGKRSENQKILPADGGFLSSRMECMISSFLLDASG